MLRLISMQLQVIFRKKGFQSTVILLTLYTFLLTIREAYKQQGYHITSLVHQATLTGLSYYSPYHGYFLMLFPFLVVLPAGFSFLVDRNTRIRTNIICRCGKKQYYISKLIAGFIATFVAMMLPFLLQLFLNCIVFPHTAGKNMAYWPLYSKHVMNETQHYLFGSFYLISPYLELLATLITTSLFASCGAVFIMGFSTFRIIKLGAFLFLPFYLFINYVPIIASTFIEGYSLRIENYLLTCSVTRVPFSLLYYVALMILLVTIGTVLVIWNEEHSL